ncbi:MAG TPA: hypothetical protein VNC41_02415, partial [Acidimicrobiia bacterium]|nr:hypothetical protein [Acidimicrobiia bacterium]
EPIALDSPRAPKQPQPARQRTIALATMLVVLAGVAGFVTTWLVLDERATPVANAVDDGQILDGLIVQQSDLGFTDEVIPLRGGSDAVNEPTLNLCNGRYPTEGSRVARRQVAVFGVEGTPKLSTEAVTYDDVATSEQAFDEIKRETARCPKTPVPNGTGTGMETTRFNAPPDADWQDTPGVQRLAYDMERTDENGSSNRSIVVYLRRGRALMGVYFYTADRAAQPSVQGRADVEAIVKIFAQRLADLPQSAISDPSD